MGPESHVAGTPDVGGIEGYQPRRSVLAQGFVGGMGEDDPSVGVLAVMELARGRDLGFFSGLPKFTLALAGAVERDGIDAGARPPRQR